MDQLPLNISRRIFFQSLLGGSAVLGFVAVSSFGVPVQAQDPGASAAQDPPAGDGQREGREGRGRGEGGRGEGGPRGEGGRRGDGARRGDGGRRGEGEGRGEGRRGRGDGRRGRGGRGRG